MNFVPTRLNQLVNKSLRTDRFELGHKGLALAIKELYEEKFPDFIKTLSSPIENPVSEIEDDDSMEIKLSKVVSSLLQRYLKAKMPNKFKLAMNDSINDWGMHMILSGRESVMFPEQTAGAMNHFFNNVQLNGFINGVRTYVYFLRSSYELAKKEGDDFLNSFKSLSKSILPMLKDLMRLPFPVFSAFADKFMLPGFHDFAKKHIADNPTIEDVVEDASLIHAQMPMENDFLVNEQGSLRFDLDKIAANKEFTDMVNEYANGIPKGKRAVGCPALYSHIKDPELADRYGKTLIEVFDNYVQSILEKQIFPFLGASANA